MFPSQNWNFVSFLFLTLIVTSKLVGYLDNLDNFAFICAQSLQNCVLLHLLGYQMQLDPCQGSSTSEGVRNGVENL